MVFVKRLKANTLNLAGDACFIVGNAIINIGENIGLWICGLSGTFHGMADNAGFWDFHTVLDNGKVGRLPSK